MDTLKLVEVAGDGSLVLMTGDGRRFSLAVDEQVRSAVRRSRNGTHEPRSGSDRPGPREVQARIRAGADAQQVAAQTGLDVDYVRRYEGPVLAERAHVADLARATPVDRGGDPTLDLERVVVEVLTGEGHDVDAIGWDSRKVDGTRWQVVVSSGSGVDRTEATWGFDTTTRSLEPADAEAERLTGVERRRRLSAVRENVFDVERPAVSPVGRGGTVELLDALARQRGRRPVTRPAEQPDATSDGGAADDGAADDGAADGGSLDDGAVGVTGRDTATDRSTAATTDDETDDGRTGHGGTAAGETRDDDAPFVEPGDDGTGGHDAGGRSHGLRVVAAGQVGPEESALSIEPDLLTELELDQPAPRPAVRDDQPARQQSAADRRSRRRRSAVPSWDEIVFGAKREDG